MTMRRCATAGLLLALIALGATFWSAQQAQAQAGELPAMCTSPTYDLDGDGHVMPIDGDVWYDLMDAGDMRADIDRNQVLDKASDAELLYSIGWKCAELRAKQPRRSQPGGDRPGPGAAVPTTPDQAVQPLAPMAPAASGGDASYDFVDNAEPTFLSGFDWVDISGTGTQLVGGDDAYEASGGFGFTFDFYGNAYTSGFVDSNGRFSFLVGGASDFSEECPLPTAVVGETDSIMLFWDDLRTTAGGGTGSGEIFTQSFAAGTCPYQGWANACFIAQWNNVNDFGNLFTIDAEVILLDNGPGDDIVVLQYNDAGNGGTDAAVGIVGPTTAQGFQYPAAGPCNVAVVSNGLAVAITPTGVAPPGGGGGGSVFISAPCNNCPLNAFPSAAGTANVTSCGTGTIVDVDVDVDLDADWMESFAIDLSSPTVGPVRLMNSLFHCDDINGFGNYDITYDDEAGGPVPVNCGTTALTGSFQPDNPLSAFDGSNAVGSWTLLVTDEEGLLDGGEQLNDWTLNLECAAAAEPSIAIDKQLISGDPHIIGVDDPVVFEISLINNGGTELSDVTVSDLFDTAYLAFSGSSIPPSATGVGSVTWNNLEAFAPGGNFETGEVITFTVSFTSFAASFCEGARAVNAASVTAFYTQGEQEVSDGPATADVEILPVAPNLTDAGIQVLTPNGPPVGPSGVDPEVPNLCETGIVDVVLTGSEADLLDSAPVVDGPGPETEVTFSAQYEIIDCTPDVGTCTFAGSTAEFDYALGVGETWSATVRLRVTGGIKNSNLFNPELCFNWDFDGCDGFQPGEEQCIEATTVINCRTLVDPNRQLDGQVHLPILNFQGQDDVCRTWIEVQYIGCDPSKAVLVTWGEPGFCPPQAAGPLKVECTGLLNPGSTWNLLGAQIPTGSKSGILFKFTAQQLSDVGLADDLGFDDVVADLMCETLFFGVVGDSDDYRRFKKAYNEGLDFAGINQGIAAGDGVLAVEVLRHCPGDVTPGVEVSSRYNGIAGSHLGAYDPIFGAFGYYVPLIYAEKAGLNTVMYIQNGGIQCSSVEIWFQAQDDCLRARICEIFTLAPGESYQWDASDCVGPDWQGSAWLRASQPLGIAVDIFGRDILMTYIGEPQPFRYVLEGTGDTQQIVATPTTGELVAYGPLIYSEYQGWDTGVQVQNLSELLNAKVKVYFLDRSGDVITTLVDWICPRGSQTFFLPVIADLPGSWVGSIRIESQEWWTPGTNPIAAPNIVGVAQLMKYSDVARTETQEAIAYNLLPEHKSFIWQVGFGGGGLGSGVGLIAIPSLLKDLDNTGTTSELAIMNLVSKPGFTDFAIYIYDQNGLLDFVCQKLHDRQVEYIDVQTWGYVNSGFKGSAIISATFWEHEVFDAQGTFLRNLVGLGAVGIERTGTRLGEDVPGDEAAGSRGIPFAGVQGDDVCLNGFLPRCPGQPPYSPGGQAAENNFSISSFPGLPILIPVANTVMDTITVNQSCVIEDLDVNVDITHTFIGDLVIDLEHGGTTVTMYDTVCGTEEDMLATFDDEAAATFNCAQSAVGNRYQPAPDSLSDFDGDNALGDWTMTVDDTIGQDGGTFNSWGMVFECQ